MPISLTNSTVNGSNNVWGTDIDNNWDAITAWVAGEEATRAAGDAARPTIDAMNAAIAAATATLLQSF